MTDNPEAFHGALVFPIPDSEPPLLRHDIDAMQALVDEGFGQERSGDAGQRLFSRPANGRILWNSRRNPVRRKQDKGQGSQPDSSNHHVASLFLQGGEIAYNSTVDIQRKRSPGDVLSRRSFTEGNALTRRLLSTSKALRTFRSENMYSDMGKTDEVIAWAPDSGRAERLE